MTIEPRPPARIMRTKPWLFDHRPRMVDLKSWSYGACWGLALGLLIAAAVATGLIPTLAISLIGILAILLGKFAHTELPLCGDDQDPYESEEYAKFVDSMAEHCSCSGQVCGGVLAGGLCDEINHDED